MMTIDQILRIAPVIPVLVIDDVRLAQPIASALVAGGLSVLEVTLRTPAALDVIREMRKVDGAIVGAGTVLNPHHLRTSLDAGSQFIVSPGLTDSLARSVMESGAAFLPGVATASDLMRGLDHGFSHFKFFPAATSGGIPALKALAAPFGGVKFCPTGGITLETAPQWLALESVLCVGGSWLVPAGSDDMLVIEQRAREATHCRT